MIVSGRGKGSSAVVTTLWQQSYWSNHMNKSSTVPSATCLSSTPNVSQQPWPIPVHCWQWWGYGWVSREANTCGKEGRCCGAASTSTKTQQLCSGHCCWARCTAVTQSEVGQHSDHMHSWISPGSWHLNPAGHLTVSAMPLPQTFFIRQPSNPNYPVRHGELATSAAANSKEDLNSRTLLPPFHWSLWQQPRLMGGGHTL